jgi:hypothetical protein
MKTVYGVSCLVCGTALLIRGNGNDAMASFLLAAFALIALIDMWEGRKG